MKPLIILSLFLTLFIVSCASTSNKVIIDGEDISDQKIETDAYLFDARLFHNDKVTSIRLNLFDADSLIGMFGRGYLGKGALKGYVRSDSINVFFPTIGEYLAERNSDLFQSMSCSTSIDEIDILELFHNTPDLVLEGLSYDVSETESEDDRKTFEISSSSCPWVIELIYDRDDDIWRIKEFNFTNLEKTRLYVKRREFKENAEVKLNRFLFNIPDGAVKIIP